MEQSLKIETEKLARSWSQHEAAWLRDYLVAGVEDPRLNLQSILTRHFLIRALEEEAGRHAALMEEEYRFSAVMNWLVDFAGKSSDAEELGLVQYALERAADNVEGIEIPSWVTQTYWHLPVEAGGMLVPNYVSQFLAGTRFENGKAVAHQESFNTFCELWRRVLAPQPDPAAVAKNLSVLEPACGSANDYRFFAACGLAPRLHYTGFDLCESNVANARRLFPGIRFEPGNVFEIAAEQKSYDYCVVHDLLEHLSLEGLEVAIAQLCRVTRSGICIGFFQMDEIPAHLVRPVEEYHWNLLSAQKIRETFARFGFRGPVMHIGTFLQARTGCERFHNPNAYTFWLEAQDSQAGSR